jgi:hypothetical protein
VVDSVAALMDGLILWWFCGCDGGSIHCMWLDVWFCFAGTKYGGKVERKKKKKLFYNILIGYSVK